MAINWKGVANFVYDPFRVMPWNVYHDQQRVMKTAAAIKTSIMQKKTPTATKPTKPSSLSKPSPLLVLALVAVVFILVKRGK